MGFVSAEEFFAGKGDGGASVPPDQRRSSPSKFYRLKVQVAMRARRISRAEAVALVESLSRQKADREEADGIGD